MLFTIFRIRKQIKDIKEGATEPSGFLFDQALDLVLVPVIIGGLITIAIIVLLGMSGYGHVFGDPSGLARFFFWLFIVAFVFAGSFIVSVFYVLRRTIKRAIDPHHKKFVKAKVRDGSSK